ncbi:MAG: hypothetical protein V3U75_13775 [Methylococcaceae bacterium]
MRLIILFGTKHNFYAEVILYGALQAGQERLEFTDNSLTPSEQLEAFIRWVLLRSLGYGKDLLMSQVHLR